MKHGNVHWARSIGRLLAGSLLVSVAVHAELRMAVNGGTKLYQSRVLKGALAPGEIVETRDYRENHDWLWVKQGDTVYLARREELVSRTDLETEDAVFVAETEAARRVAERDVVENLTSRRQLAEAVRLVQVDELLYFRTAKPKLILVDEPTNRPGVVLTPNYGYDRLISGAQSGRLQRQWGKDLDDVNERLVELWRKLLAVESEQLKRAARLRVARQRFEAYEEDDAHYRASPHIVTARSTTLYQDRAPGARLQRGDIVGAWLNDWHRGWLDVLMEGEVHQADGRHLQDAYDLLADLQRDGVVDRLRGAQLESDIEFSRFLEALLSRLSLQLEYGTRSSGYLVVPRFGVNAPRNRLHTIDHPADAVVVYRRGSGQRTLGDWDEEMGALVEAREKMQEELKELRGRAVRTQAEISKLQKALGPEKGELE